MAKNKIAAITTAAVMSFSMVATTAMSASATEVAVNAQEEVESVSISTTGQKVVWNSSSDGTSELDYFVGKYSDSTKESMAASGITSATLTKSGSTYTLKLTTKSIEKTFLGTSYTADIKTVKAVFKDGSTVTGSKSGSTFTISFDTSKELPWVGESNAKGKQNSIQLDFTTTLEDESVFSLLPSSMKNPQTYLLFTT